MQPCYPLSSQTFSLSTLVLNDRKAVWSSSLFTTASVETKTKAKGIKVKIPRNGGGS